MRRGLPRLRGRRGRRRWWWVIMGRIGLGWVLYRSRYAGPMVGNDDERSNSNRACLNPEFCLASNAGNTTVLLPVLLVAIVLVVLVVLLVAVLLLVARFLHLLRLVRAVGRLARDARPGADEVVARVAAGLRRLLVVRLSGLGRLEEGGGGSRGSSRGSSRDGSRGVDRGRGLGRGGLRRCRRLLAAGLALGVVLRVLVPADFLFGRGGCRRASTLAYRTKADDGFL